MYNNVLIILLFIIYKAIYYFIKQRCTMVIYNKYIYVYAYISYTLYIDTFDDIYIVFSIFRIDFNMYMTVNTEY